MLQSALSVGKMAKNAPDENSHVSLSIDPSGAPSGFESVWSNNPYANFDYRHTWWQKLLEGVGIRTNYDAYKESLALNAREEQARVLEEARQQEYDSASAQAQRERAAGINPDLVGNVDAGDSASGEPDANVPIAPSASDLQAFQGFANTIMSAFTGSIGLAKDAMSLFNMKNDVDSGRISNSSKIVDYAMNMARQFIPESYPEGYADWVNRAVDQAFDVGSLGLSNKQQKQFRRALTSFYQSAPTQAEQWKAWNESQSGKFDYFKRTSSEFFQDGSDEVLRIITDNLMKVQDNIFKRGLNLESQRQQNESEYLSSFDPSLQGEVENVTNQRNIESGKIDYYLNEALGSIVEDLRDRSESGKKGHGFAQVALLVFSVLRMMNFHPSFSSSSGTTAKGTDFSSSSFGF